MEPFDPDTGVTKKPFQRTETLPVRPCNTIDVGFRNQVGCPVHMYWANQLSHVPEEGFNCGEKFRFHLGTKAAPQDVSTIPLVHNIFDDETYMIISSYLFFL